MTTPTAVYVAEAPCRYCPEEPCHTAQLLQLSREDDLTWLRETKFRTRTRRLRVVEYQELEALGLLGAESRGGWRVQVERQKGGGTVRSFRAFGVLRAVIGGQA